MAGSGGEALSLRGGAIRHLQLNDHIDSQEWPPVTRRFARTPWLGRYSAALDSANRFNDDVELASFTPRSRRDQ
jgi:hypothetical protein